MTELLIYVGTLLAGLAVFFGLKAGAAKFGPASEGMARQAFEALPGFAPGAVYAYLGSAIGYDPARNVIAIFEKSGGARLIDPDGIAAWHSGMLLTQVLTRTTSTLMIQLYSSADARRPFFKVGVLQQADCAAWRKRLQNALGRNKERESDARILAVS